MFILNMGSFLLFYIIFPLFIIIVALVQLLSPCCPNVRAKTDQILNRFFFNSILRFIEETYLITALCSFINLRYAMHGGVSDDLNYYLTIGFFIIIIGFPIFQTALLFVKFDTITSFSFTNRAGVGHEDLNLKTETSRLKWPLYLTFSKFVLAFILVFSLEYPFAQLTVINFVSVFYLIGVGWLRPYKLPERNKWELFQEYIVFLIFYHLFCATDWIQDVNARDYVGWSMIIITCLSLAIDLARLIAANLNNLWWLARKVSGKHKIKKELKRRSTLADYRRNRLGNL